MTPTPYRLIEAQHGEGCDLDHHHWVTLRRRGARFHVRQCASCYTIDYDDLEAQVDAENELRWTLILDTMAAAFKAEFWSAILARP